MGSSTHSNKIQEGMMDSKTIENLIHHYEAGLTQYRMQMGFATQILVEQTIKALEELKAIKEAEKV